MLRMASHKADLDRRTVKMRQLFAEARKRGIDQDELRNISAPGIIGHRLSAATVGEIIEVIRHITGGEADGFRKSEQPGNFKDRFEDLGLRDGMATPFQLRKIEAMWMSVSIMRTRHDKEQALNRFLKRIVGVEHLRFVEDWQVQKIVKAIESMKRKTRGQRCDNATR